VINIKKRFVKRDENWQNSYILIFLEAVWLNYKTQTSAGQNHSCSLRSTRSSTKWTKFAPPKLVFRIQDARKMGREQKGGRKGVG